jgi:tetratricopeptide (TPR) repeat protein
VIARARPLLTLLTVVVLAAGTAVGLWRYAVHQWHTAQADLEGGRPHDARERLTLCLSVWPRSTEVHLLAARAARLSGDLDDAEYHLGQCLKLNDGATNAVQIEYLLLRVQTGEVDDVAQALISAVESGHPESPLILETLARSYIIRLRYKSAYACLTRWIEQQPSVATAYQWRGYTLERLNNHKMAVVDYHKALELDPDLIPVRLRIAEMLLEDKQAPEALPHLERLYRQAPTDPLVQGRLGMCRFLQGDIAEARRLMEAAVVHLPKDPELHVYLARIDLMEGRGVEAERRLRMVLESDPSDTETLYNLASALQLQGRTAEAAAVRAEYDQKRIVVDRINELLKDVADSPTATANDHAEIGRLLLEIGRDKLGMYWVNRALERDPTNQQAHLALAAHYDRKGDAVKAAGHRRQLRTAPAANAVTSPPNPERQPNP